MKPKPEHADARQAADPFGEGLRPGHVRRYRLLGADVEFHSEHADLLALVDAAYRGLPAHGNGGPSLQVDLRMSDGGAAFGSEPPAARMLGGAGVQAAVMDAHNLAVVNPATASAVVHLSPALLKFPYHARYELIEFAVYTLVSRARRLVPLHAGCVGAAGVGALLIGTSGAGKSTLALQAMQQGLDFLTEDATFVDPDTLLATGVANFLHLRFDAVDWVDDAALRARIETAPVIRRRSGVEKFELDLRGNWARLAAEPVRLAHLVFASAASAPDGELLRPLDVPALHERLRLSQPYGATQAGWDAFLAGCGRCHGWELRRGSHPRFGAQALQALLMA